MITDSPYSMITNNIYGKEMHDLKVRIYMRELLAHHYRFRGSVWDVLFITAADEAQREWFQAQMERKQARRELHPDLQFRVQADPSPEMRNGQPLGSGGATLQALLNLHKELGDSLFQKRVLILHAGGMSKRMPAHSCGGKLFATLPQPFPSPACYSPLCWDLLDYKLALYRPFAQFMKGGGVFVSASDDLEIFDLRTLEVVLQEMTFNGVTALAHPSALKLASGHGVFVVPPPVVPEGQIHPIWFSRCLRVLQKPSEALMRESGAVFGYRSSLGKEKEEHRKKEKEKKKRLGRWGQEEEEDRVLSDSVFWMAPDTVRRFFQFARDNQKEVLQNETCIYTDFIQLMGDQAQMSVLPAAARDNADSASNCQLREKIGELVSQTRLRVLVLWRSEFFHLGSMREYVDLMRWDSPLLPSLWMPLAQDKGIIMASILSQGCQVAPNAVVELSRVDTSVLVIPPRTVLSHCHLDASVDAGLELPSGFLFHTVPVRVQDRVCFATIAFSVDENPKAVLSSSGETLWQTRKFACEDSRPASFLHSLKLVQRTFLDMDVQIPHSDGPFYNMPEVLANKDMDAFFAFRDEIFLEIGEAVEDGDDK